MEGEAQKLDGLRYTKQAQYDEDHDNNDQNVNPIPSLGESWAYISSQEAEQPQDEQNYDNGPQHQVSPLE